MAIPRVVIVAIAVIQRLNVIVIGSCDSVMLSVGSMQSEAVPLTRTRQTGSQEFEEKV